MKIDDADLALLRWSVACREWQGMSTGSQPDLGAFLAGWHLRRLGYELPHQDGKSWDSMRSGWCDAGVMKSIEDREKAEGKKVFVVTTGGHNYAIKESMEEAEGVVAELLSDTGVDIEEDDIDIEEWKIGDVATPDEGPDRVF